jgi:hypothetical protein
MPDYSVWYDDIYTYKGYFTADSREQALELLNKVELGEILMDQLPGFAFKDKGYQLEVDPGTLEEN